MTPWGQFEVPGRWLDDEWRPLAMALELPDELTTPPSWPVGEGALAGAAGLRRAAEHSQMLAVRRARHAGLSWAEIADALGVSKQAAHRKYRGRDA